MFPDIHYFNMSKYINSAFCYTKIFKYVSCSDSR